MTGTARTAVILRWIRKVPLPAPARLFEGGTGLLLQSTAGLHTEAIRVQIFAAAPSVFVLHGRYNQIYKLQFKYISFTSLH